MTFAEKLKELRGDETQSALAERAGVPLPTLRGLEQGRRSPSWKTVVRLARTLGHPSSVFDGCDEVRDKK